MFLLTRPFCLLSLKHLHCPPPQIPLDPVEEVCKAGVGMDLSVNDSKLPRQRRDSGCQWIS